MAHRSAVEGTLPEVNDDVALTKRDVYKSQPSSPILPILNRLQHFIHNNARVLRLMAGKLLLGRATSRIVPLLRSKYAASLANAVAED